MGKYKVNIFYLVILMVWLFSGCAQNVKRDVASKKPPQQATRPYSGSKKMVPFHFVSIMKWKMQSIHQSDFDLKNSSCAMKQRIRKINKNFYLSIQLKYKIRLKLKSNSDKLPPQTLTNSQSTMIPMDIVNLPLLEGLSITETIQGAKWQYSYSAGHFRINKIEKSPLGPDYVRNQIVKIESQANLTQIKSVQMEIREGAKSVASHLRPILQFVSCVERTKPFEISKK